MKPINLADHGIRVFAGRLYNHDYLWFSSTEISKVSTTLPVIHNYALTYALSAFSYAVYWGNTPRYVDDLAQMPLYTTPAMTSRDIARTKLTHNAVDSLSLRTDVGPGVNTPNLGWRICLDPSYAAQNKRKYERGFTFYAFVFIQEHQERFGDSKPQSAFRLGKKGAPVRVHWRELTEPRAVFREEATRPGHLVNPLDISGQVRTFNAINIPPHLVLQNADIVNDWFIFGDGAPVHLPKTVRTRISG